MRQNICHLTGFLIAERVKTKHLKDFIPLSGNNLFIKLFIYMPPISSKATIIGEHSLLSAKKKEFNLYNQILSSALKVNIQA